MAKAWGRKRITVVFVERVPWGGGAERVVLDIARHLDKRRFRPLVVCLYEGKEAPRHFRKSIPFVKLAPRSLLDLTKAVLSGRLGPELYPELELAAEHILRRLDDLKAYIENAKHRTRLRLHNLRAAWATGQSSNYLKERICKWLGVPYLGQPFVYPTDLPPSATLARLRILRSRLRLRTRFRNLLQTRGVGRPPIERENTTSQERTIPLTPSSPRSCLNRRPIDISRQARLFAAFANTLRGPVVVVPVMEEAASLARLALGEGPRARWPYILSTHAWESYYLPLIYACLGFDVNREIALFAAACRGAEAIVSPCTGCRDDLVEHFGSPRERTLCMPNPVDVKQIRADAEAPLSVPLPVASQGRPLLLHVGRLDPQKRHRLLFEACLRLKERDQSFHLVCLGDGHIRKDLEELIDQLGLRDHVTLLGFIGNPFPYMRRARALVLPSESESFALVLVEALACGCVPIAVDCPHGPRDVLDGGRGGFLVREDTPEALAQAMYQALHEDTAVAEKLHHGTSWIERYSLTQIVPQWETLLSHVAITHSSPY